MPVDMRRHNPRTEQVSSYDLQRTQDNTQDGLSRLEDGVKAGRSYAGRLILKDSARPPHYWDITVDDTGAIVTRDLGVTPP